MFSYKKITTRPAAAAAPIDAGRSVPAMSSVHRGTIATVAAKSANPPALGAKKSTFATSWRSIKTAARRVSGRKVTQGVSSSGLGWISAESLGDAGFQLVSSRFSPVADAKIPSTSYSAPFDFDKVASMELPVDLTTAQAFADKLWMAIIAVHQELMGFQVPFPAFGIKRDATFDRATLFAMKEHHDVVVRLLARCVAEFENSNMAFFHNMRLSATDKIASSAKTVLEEQEKALAKERLLADVDAWLGLKPEQAAPKVSITRKARITRKKLEQEEREAQEMDEATALQVDNMSMDILLGAMTPSVALDQVIKTVSSSLPTAPIKMEQEAEARSAFIKTTSSPVKAPKKPSRALSTKSRSVLSPRRTVPTTSTSTVSSPKQRKPASSTSSPGRTSTSFSTRSLALKAKSGIPKLHSECAFSTIESADPMLGDELDFEAEIFAAGNLGDACGSFESLDSDCTDLLSELLLAVKPLSPKARRTITPVSSSETLVGCDLSFKKDKLAQELVIPDINIVEAEVLVASPARRRRKDLLAPKWQPARPATDAAATLASTKPLRVRRKASRVADMVAALEATKVQV